MMSPIRKTPGEYLNDNSENEGNLTVRRSVRMSMALENKKIVMNHNLGWVRVRYINGFLNGS